MVPLDDPIWDDLSGHYFEGREFANILRRYHRGLIPERDLLYEDLLHCACDGEIYDSIYAAAPHLVDIASSAPAPAAAIMLCFVADAYAAANSPNYAPVHPKLRPALDEIGPNAASIATKVLEQLQDDCPEKEPLESSLLAFRGDYEGYWAAQEELLSRVSRDYVPPLGTELPSRTILRSEKSDTFTA